MRKSIIILFILAACMPIYAQRDSLGRYDRPSICELMVSRGGRIFEREVELAFRDKPIPERFNDHGLGVKTVQFATNETDIHNEIIAFLRQQNVAKKLVSKWFSRKKQTGDMDIHLVTERGLYNANKIDVAIARQTIRGEHILADAGEKLIHRTFIIVHDYSFDYKYCSFKQNGANNTEEESLNRVLDLNNREDVDWYNNQLYKGDLQLANISVGCISYLFQLQWTEETAAVFYQNYYTTETNHDQNKVNAFNADKSTFQLSYLGKYESNVKEKNPYNYPNQKLVQKACVRLVDQNIAALQHQFPQFRIKARLQGVGEENKVFKAYIGLKEDVKASSKFEVLEPELHDDGSYSYQRVGIVQPIAAKIWDNRYMATEETSSELDATYFKQISGGELYPGLLIRELE